MAKPHASNDDGEPGWGELVERFGAYLEGEDRSPHTVRRYKDDLGVFADWFRRTHEEEPAIGRLIKRDLADFRAALEATGGRDGGRAAVATVAGKISAARSFFKFLASIDLGPRFDPPKPPRRSGPAEPRWLSKAEERALLVALEAADVPRDTAIIYMGLHGGLRVAEMAALDWSDIHISERKGEMIVRGKGRKERVVKLSKTLRRALLDHGLGKRKGPVCDGRRGRLTPRGIQDIASRYAAAARVGKVQGIKDFSHHCLRHTCARRMVDAHVPVVDIAAHLGHADVKTTMVYVASKGEDLARAVEALDEAG